MLTIPTVLDFSQHLTWESSINVNPGIKTAYFVCIQKLQSYSEMFNLHAN